MQRLWRTSLGVTGDQCKRAHLLWPWAAAKCKGVNPFSWDTSAGDPEDSSSFTHADKQETDGHLETVIMGYHITRTTKTARRTQLQPCCHGYGSGVLDRMLPKCVGFVRARGFSESLGSSPPHFKNKNKSKGAVFSDIPRGLASEVVYYLR